MRVGNWLSAVVPGLAITGIGVGLATGPLAAAVLVAVPSHRGGMASGALNTARQLGYALGIATLGLVCESGVLDGLDDRRAGAAACLRAAAVAHCVGAVLNDSEAGSIPDPTRIRRRPVGC